MSITPFEFIVIVTASTQDKFREILPTHTGYHFSARLNRGEVHRVAITTMHNEIATYTYAYSTLVRCIKDILYEYPNVPRLTVNQFEKEMINHVHVT